MGASSAKMYNPTDATAAEINNMALATNVVLIPYSIILQEKNFQSQQPHSCRGCGGILNMFSKLCSFDEYVQKREGEPVNDQEKAEEESKSSDKDYKYMRGVYFKDIKANEAVWICEFCDVHNKVLSDIVLPKTERELYLIKKNVTTNNSEIETTEGNESESKDETSLIFAIDTSGSMAECHAVTKDGVTQNVQRIRLVVDAVLEQLKEMRKSHPNRKVGVVLFESSITFLGDCSTNPYKQPQNLKTFEELLNDATEKGETMVTKPLSESYPQLEKTIRSLSARGGTALGPGLLGALALARQGKAGSRIILCTDGQASVDYLGNAQKPFYERVGDIATQKGISVSIITVKGQACQVDALGPLTDRTAGQIIRIDPANFDLSSLAANNMIATNVKLKAVMHEGLAFKNQDSSNLFNNDSVLIKNIGSVAVNNEAYFEYRVKNVEELQKAEVNLDELDFLPLQAQISYKDLEGNEFVLVVSRRQELTKDQKEAERGVKAEILAGYVQKESVNLMLGGKIEEAKKANELWAQQLAMMANNVDMDEVNKKALEDFKTQNQQLQDLMNVGPMQNAVQKDEITSKLYEIKQQKQSKF